ncbi:hypothetical protein K438DRAFT_1822771 [Mycena galopus ATCC 62051]|nr:hypothetical protein K438DRAFT_1822771 [Mycena galopus ATCC 62051]
MERKGLGHMADPETCSPGWFEGSRLYFHLADSFDTPGTPTVNGLFGDLTPAEVEAWSRRINRVIRFFQEVGFRRLANSHFFCFAKESSHPSHFVSIEADAVFQELPRATTEEEQTRRYMAYH